MHKNHKHMNSKIWCGFRYASSIFLLLVM